jgi:hypothetical protein
MMMPPTIHMLPKAKLYTRSKTITDKEDHKPIINILSIKIPIQMLVLTCRMSKVKNQRPVQLRAYLMLTMSRDLMKTLKLEKMQIPLLKQGLEPLILS